MRKAISCPCACACHNGPHYSCTVAGGCGHLHAEHRGDPPTAVEDLRDLEEEIDAGAGDLHRRFVDAGRTPALLRDLAERADTTINWATGEEYPLGQVPRPAPAEAVGPAVPSMRDLITRLYELTAAPADVPAALAARPPRTPGSRGWLTPERRTEMVEWLRSRGLGILAWPSIARYQRRCQR